MLLEPYIAKVVKKSAPTPDRQEADWVSGEYLPLLAKEPTDDLIQGISGVSEVYGGNFKQMWEETAAVAQVKILKELLLILPPGELRALSAVVKGA